tara:strand:+ start:253 stop:684 length:432 start_codon:yes stop_codon:yes gene_type:complete
MIYISHRGNLTGKSEKDENNPDYLMKAIESGFDVEIDVWFKNNKFYLGHDKPSFEVGTKFLENPRFWCHAKNINALSELARINCHYFWHQEDDFTLTSKGIIWTYPGKYLTNNSVCVLPESTNVKKFDCLGICSDLIENYKND